MPKPKPERRYTVAKGPVNRRTAWQDAHRSAPLSPRLRERMGRLRTKRMLGTSISQVLGERSRSGLPSPALVVLVLSSIATVFAAALGRSAAGLALALAGLAVMGASGWRVLRGMRSKPAESMAQAGPPIFDAATLRKLDEAMEAVAAALPEQLVPDLLRLKATLVGVAQGMAQPLAGSAFGLEDRAYVVECVRRYIPDTISAYLAIPAAHRDQPVQETGSDAHAILREQLGAIQAELDRRHAKLVADAGERLLMQQRFLQSKSGGR